MHPHILYTMRIRSHNIPNCTKALSSSQRFTFHKLQATFSTVSSRKVESLQQQHNLVRSRHRTTKVFQILCIAFLDNAPLKRHQQVSVPCPSHDILTNTYLHLLQREVWTSSLCFQTAMSHTLSQNGQNWLFTRWPLTPAPSPINTTHFTGWKLLSTNYAAFTLCANHRMMNKLQYDRTQLPPWVGHRDDWQTYLMMTGLSQ